MVGDMDDAPAPKPWVQLAEHFPGDEGLLCPIDRVPWPCLAESEARRAWLMTRLAASRWRFEPEGLTELLARFDHESGPDWPAREYADEDEQEKNIHRGLARAYLARLEQSY
jgi:hypothetical protein